MGRKKKKPEFDPERTLNEILDNVVEAYEHLEEFYRKKTGGQLAYGVLKELADELEFSPAKVKRLLITAGIRDNKEIYMNDTCRQVLALYHDGKSIYEIMESTGLSRTGVFCYLPYSKTVYKAKDLSTDAERIRLFRERQKLCQTFMTDISGMTDPKAEEYLWEVLKKLQGCIFHTSGRGSRPGIRFKYRINGGEMFVDRKEKSITRATVILAYRNAIEIQSDEGCVAGPKKLGTFGASYLYPIFLRLGICTATEMEGSVMEM